MFDEWLLPLHNDGDTTDEVLPHYFANRKKVSSSETGFRGTCLLSLYIIIIIINQHNYFKTFNNRGYISRAVSELCLNFCRHEVLSGNGDTTKCEMFPCNLQYSTIKRQLKIKLHTFQLTQVKIIAACNYKNYNVVQNIFFWSEFIYWLKFHIKCIIFHHTLCILSTLCILAILQYAHLIFVIL